MAGHSKRYREMIARVNRKRTYSVREAVQALRELKPKAAFDESVDLAMKLNINPKQPDQMVRGTFALPHGTGKEVRVIAFCEGEAAEEARQAGATEVGAEDLAGRIQGGWMEFDVAIADPAAMKFVSRLGRILGPQGKMPSPKSGTVTPDVASAVKEFRAGKIEYRADAQGNVLIPVGRVSFPEDRLVENIAAFVEHIQASRPSSVRGTFLQGAHVSTTMGPGLKIAV